MSTSAIKYPLATSTWDEKELEAMQTVIKSGHFTMGEQVQEFESKFAEYLGAKYCVMVNSGSSANLLALASLFYTKESQLKEGDEVIVPAVSWATTYFPLQQYGLKIKFVDIDAKTLNYDLNTLEKAISNSTRLVVAVNLLGNPNDFEKINSLIENKDIILFEDNCESLGASYQGRMAGTFGKLGTYSSFFSHHISTMEGGLISTDDEELYHIMLSMRSHGWTRHLPDNNKVTGKKEDWFQESFKFVLPGYNLRPLELEGAIGLEQIKKLPKLVDSRRENAKLFVDIFKDNPLFDIQEEIGESSWFGFSLILKKNSKISRSKVLSSMTEAGIECRPIVSGDFTKNPVMKYLDYSIFDELKNADHLHKNGFFVGNHHYSLEEELNYLYESIMKV